MVSHLNCNKEPLHKEHSLTTLPMELKVGYLYQSLQMTQFLVLMHRNVQFQILTMFQCNIHFYLSKLYSTRSVLLCMNCYTLGLHKINTGLFLAGSECWNVVSWWHYVDWSWIMSIGNFITHVWSKKQRLHILYSWNCTPKAHLRCSLLFPRGSTYLWWQHC